MATPDPLQILRHRFGFPAFRTGQRELVDAALAGRDALGVLPTGGGKSLCFQVPCIALPGLTVVVSPLISLMADQLRRAREAEIRAEAIHSGLSPERREAVARAAVAGEVELLLLAPERLLAPSFEPLLPHLKVSLLVIDEAHCISCWGHDFRPAYRELGRIRRRLGAPVQALTATATPRVRSEIEEILEFRRPVRVVGSFDRDNLLWAVRTARSPAERNRILYTLVRRAPGARLIYAATRKRVERIRAFLARRGLRVEAYHAGLPEAERTRVQAFFMEATGPVVVATNAFGMGIDRSDVRLVVHDQLSGSLEDYYQEAGRAGRDGEVALCVGLRGPGDGGVHRAFLDRTHPPVRTPGEMARLWREGGLGRRLERRRAQLAKIRAVGRYAETRGCRRAALLGWFGEKWTGRCTRCDRCSGWPGVLGAIGSR
ncbi:MAG: ATP-dependent DNA helicase RecQ [Gemmatimonadales bacterium]|nr:MAG: ATP-dependent DNA helicase RecQ [Gemmatimonadales bacterium]